jgi:microcystin-dependent protein
MANPFLGQLLLVGFNYAPYQWAQCSGQLLPISSNTALFSLLGVNFGGDGIRTFGLPNLQGNVAVGFGQGSGLSRYDLGETGGTATVTLNSSQTPNHTHTPQAATLLADQEGPGGNAFAKSAAGNVYNNATSTPALSPMSTSAITAFNGGSLSHENMMPYLALNWVIAMQGVFPQRP